VSEETVHLPGWTLDLAARRLTSDAGQPVRLTQAEYRILALLVLHPGQVITRDQLTEAVAGRRWQKFDRSVDVHISNLRRKLARTVKPSDPIRTVRGAGYMFVPRRD
jgi:DNA-binding response OmpR family regulator